MNTGLLRASRVGCTWRPTRAKRQSQTGSSALSLPPLPLLLEVVEPKHKVLGEPRAHVDQVHLRLQTQKHTGGKKKDGGLVDAVHLPPLRTAPLARADQIASCAAERTQRARWLRRPPPPLPPPPCPPPPPPPPPRQAGGSWCGGAASLARPRCGLLFTAAAVKRRRSQRLCGAGGTLLPAAARAAARRPPPRARRLRRERSTWKGKTAG